MTVSDVLNEGVRKTGWEPGGVHVAEAARSLTKAERRHVMAGYNGDCSMPVLRSLRHKAIFYLKITSPNGRCGHMVLTPLGENVRALLADRQAARQSKGAV